MHAAAVGDLVQLFSMRDRKSFLLRIQPDERLETHNGVIQHSDLVGKPFGSTVHSHLGTDFVMLTPSTAEITRTLKRRSQIIFPKDLGLILLKLSIEPDQEVIEAGTGSGALTVALAGAVVFGVYPRPLFELAQESAQSIGGVAAAVSALSF